MQREGIQEVYFYIASLSRILPTREMHRILASFQIGVVFVNIHNTGKNTFAPIHRSNSTFFDLDRGL